MSNEETAPYGSGPAKAPAAPAAPRKRIRTHHLREMKERGEKITMLTAYDMFTAATFDEATDRWIVAAGNGARTTASICVMATGCLSSLTRAVARAATRAMVVGDLPFGSYQASPEQAYLTAVRFMKEAGAHCVKLEGGAEMVPVIEKLTQGGIPVMAHIGFTPQSEHALGGYRVQGRGETAERVKRDAKAVEAAGAFAVVMEMVPGDVAGEISRELTIPTIGIGAGNGCDGQVLVWQDAFGLRTGRMARFVKQYADVHQVLLDGARAYAEDVKAGTFPGPEHTF